METQTQAKSYQEFLIEELKTRQLQNPRFSLRSFAKFLSISPSQLSQLISGKRNLTSKQALKIAEKLGLSRHQIQSLLAPYSKKTESALSDYRTLSESEFSLISDWKYYAILSLGKIAKNKADPAWIAERLGIPLKAAEEAFEKLLFMQYVQITRSGNFRQSTRSLTISSEVGSAEIRKFHKTNLDLAKEKLESVPPAWRDFSSSTMAFPLSKIQKAKDMIADFRRSFTAEMELGQRDQVYTLAIQFFPLTKKSQSEERR